MADKVLQRDAPGDSSPQPVDLRPIAPLWHTVLLVMLIAATSWLGTRHTSEGGLRRAHLGTYGLTLLWEWVLAAFAFWGLRLR